MKLPWTRKWVMEKAVDRSDPSEAADRRSLQVDRIVRTTHAIDCGGGCLVEIGVRDDEIIWERPVTQPDDTTVRYCSRAPAGKTYLSNRYRILKPMVRESLLEAWTAARAEASDPVAAWRLLRSRGSAQSWRETRGKGGFRPVDQRTAEQIVAAATVATTLDDGPRSILGYTSPSPSALVGRSSGMRFLNLLGGQLLEPPETATGIWEGLKATWGNGVPTAPADNWLNSAFLVVCGGAPEGWMPADYPLLVEARTRGARLWVVDDCPGSLLQHADGWTPLSPPRTAAFWAAVNRLLLRRLVSTPGDTWEPFLLSTDAPLLVQLTSGLVDDARRVGPPLAHRRVQSAGTKGLPDPCFTVWDEISGRPVAAPGSPGLKSVTGAWSLRNTDPLGGQKIRPALRAPSNSVARAVELPDPFTAGLRSATVPVFTVEANDGTSLEVTTLFELLLARYSAGAAAAGTGLNDDASFRSWFEESTALPLTELERFVDAWLDAAEPSGSRCSVVCGPSLLHDRRGNQGLAEIAKAAILSRAVGQPGGGVTCYPGRPRILALEGFQLISEATDWFSPESESEAAEAACASGRLLFTWLYDPYFSNPANPGERLHSTLPPPGGRLDGNRLELIVHLSFRMDVTAAQADVILPVCTWYEKDELSSTEQTGCLLGAPRAVQPRAHSLPEWQVFRRLAACCSSLAPPDAPETIRLLGHRYAQVGPVIRETEEEPRPDPRLLRTEIAVGETMLRHSTAADGRLAARALAGLGSSAGVDLSGWIEQVRHQRITWSSLAGQPRRPLPTPESTDWSRPGSDAAPFAGNLRHEIPWPTLSGRQQLWPELWSGDPVARRTFEEVRETPASALSCEDQAPSAADGIRLRFRHLSDPWTFGSLFAEIPIMRQLFRGSDTAWLHPTDATALTAADGDWLQLSFVGRSVLVLCVISRSVPPGTCIARLPDSLILIPGCPGDPLEGADQAVIRPGDAVSLATDDPAGWVQVRKIISRTTSGEDHR